MKPACAVQLQIVSDLASHGLHLSSRAEVEAGYAMAVRLIGPALADLQTVHAAQERTRSACYSFIEDGELTGLFVFLLANDRGLEALMSDAFDPLSPDMDLLAAPDQRPAAYYGWALAGTTPAARLTVITAANHLRHHTLRYAPCFCHVATEAGRRAVTGKLGYSPVQGSISGLYRAPAVAELESVGA